MTNALRSPVNDRPLRVLLVEDNLADVRLVQEMVRDAGAGELVLTQVERLHQALHHLAAEGFDAVLLDLALPDSIGIETFARTHTHSPGIPIVVLTGLSDESIAVQAVRDGAQDYLVKGRVDGHFLVHAIRYAIERKRVEQALRSSEARFRALIEATFDGYVIHEDGVIRDANEGFARMFGYDRPEVVGKRITDFVAETQRESVAKLIRSEEREQYETMGLGRDGSVFPIEAVVRTHLTASGTVRVAGVRDISARRRLEQQLMRSQKMEAMGRLAGGVAHDFNNVLTAIGSLTDLLLTDCPADDLRRADLDEIRTAVRRGADLVRQLLAFSKPRPSSRAVLDLNRLVSGVEKLLRRVIGERIELMTGLAPDAGEVECDHGELEQVLLNLAVNARDAMPDGGKLAISTGAEEIGAAGGAADTPQRAGRYAVLTVTDTGTGMDEATLSRVFEPFFTTKEEGKGTGLGLAMVYSTVRQCGGHIAMASEVGRGTTFKIFLPQARRHV